MVKINKTITISFIFLFVLGSSALAFLPETTPCRWDGDVFDTDGVSPLIDVTVEGFVNGEYQKEFLVEDINAYTMTLQGNAEDVADFTICGAPAGTDIFEEYGKRDLNLTFVKLADGESNCTCDAACIGGICVSPGITTGICSSETYYCDNDGSCEEEYGETTDTCASDCSVGDLGATSSTGGGGGGGCTPYWDCGSWGPCLSGEQTRTCADKNSCGSLVGIPSIEQECECIESWTCFDWSECADGEQERACLDLNDCGTTKNRPDLTRSCTSLPGPAVLETEGEEGTNPITGFAVLGDTLQKMTGRGKAVLSLLVLISIVGGYYTIKKLKK